MASLVIGYFAAHTWALDPRRAVSDYLVERWGIERGFPDGTVTAIAQSGDGYLWIGTDKGLIRFDGVNFHRFPQAGQLPFAIGAVQSLQADADGNLWILLQSTKVLRYRNGKFELCGEQAEFGVTAMGRRSNGAVLLSSLSYGTLTFDGGRFRVIQPNEETATSSPETSDTLSNRLSWDTSLASHHLSEPNAETTSLEESADGKVWLGTRNQGLFLLAGGRASLVAPVRMTGQINCLLPWPDGKLWIGTDRGVTTWNGTALDTTRLSASLRSTKVLALTRDRDGNAWIGTESGLIRVDAAGNSWSAQAVAASTGPVTALFEDREGNLWAGTSGGIERFRDGAFVTHSVGAQPESSGPVYVDAEGRAWFAPFEGGLHWLKDGKRGRVTNDGLDKDVVYSIADGEGALWIGRQQGGLTSLRYRGGVITTKTYTTADGLPQNTVYAVYASKDGSVWAATLSAGVALLRSGHFAIYSTANGMSSDSVSAIAQTPDGTMWFATPNGLNAFSKGSWRIFTTRDGLSSDNLTCLFPDSTGTLWIGSNSGLAFLSSGHIGRPSTERESLREPVFGLAADNEGRLWIATANHILSAKRSALRGELDPSNIHEYGLADGLQGTGGVKREPSVVVDAGGRVWFSTNRGLAVVDAARVDNPVPAIVHVEGISADGNTMDPQEPVRLPPGGHRVTFSYSGLSFAIPERVRFKYKLEGFDQGWSEPTTAREAVYTNLGAGKYRFRVMASNGSGVWNSAEASVPLQVAPALWQTWWFRVGMVVLAALAALAGVRLRVMTLAKQMRVRFEERLAERTRIAQELHDTLLQGMISASMQLHVVVEQVPPDSPAKPALDRILNLMRRVTEEGRTAVGGLRSQLNSSLELGEAFSEVRREFDPQNKIDFEVVAEGPARPLHPMIRDEIYSIGREALTNAFRHARATRLEVELEYAAGGLRVLVRDNGDGFDSEMLRAGRDGHWGLSGMRERAKRINAKLRVLSRVAAGTEVELTVPSQIAFVPEPRNGSSKWWGKVWRNKDQVPGESASEYES